MNEQFDAARRYWLKRGVSATTLAMVAASGLLLPQHVLAHWPRDAYNALTVEDALRALMGDADMVDDDAVYFSVGSPPTYAVNGATVPVEINTTLENVEHIALLVEKNPSPLAMSFEPTEDVMLPFKTMLKVAEDSAMLAVLRAEGKLYVTRRYVEVDIGGCA